MCLETTAVQNASVLYGVSTWFLVVFLVVGLLGGGGVSGAMAEGRNTYVKTMAIRTINQLRPQYVF